MSLGKSLTDWLDPIALLSAGDLPGAVAMGLAEAGYRLFTDDRDAWGSAAAKVGATVPPHAVDDPQGEYESALAAARGFVAGREGRAELQGAAGLARVDTMLDVGAAGLKYFQEYLPLAQQVRPVDYTYARACRRYDEQRGMDTQALARDGDVLTRAAHAAGEAAGQQQRQAMSLTGGQSGAAIDAATAFLARQAARADGDIAHLAGCGQTMTQAASALHEVVRNKAHTVAALYTGEVKGCTRAEIAAMIALVNGGDGAAAPVLRLAHVVGVLGGPTSFALNEAGIAVVREACARWLRCEFWPAVEGTCRQFDVLCTDTDRAVRQIYTHLTGLLGQMGTEPYPEPDACPTSADGGASPVGVSGGGTAGVPSATPAASRGPAASSGAGVSRVSPAGFVPPSTAPAGFEPQPTAPAAFGSGAAAPSTGIAAGAMTSATSGFSALSGDFGGQVAREVESVGRSVGTALRGLRSGFDDVAGEIRDGVEKAVERGLSGLAHANLPSEFRLGDVDISFHLSGGALAMQVEGADAVTRHFELAIGPDGMPHLTLMEEPADPGDGTDAAGGSDDGEPVPDGSGNGSEAGAPARRAEADDPADAEGAASSAPSTAPSTAPPTGADSTDPGPGADAADPALAQAPEPPPAPRHLETVIDTGPRQPSTPESGSAPQPVPPPITQPAPQRSLAPDTSLRDPATGAQLAEID